MGGIAVGGPFGMIVEPLMAVAKEVLDEASMVADCCGTRRSSLHASSFRSSSDSRPSQRVDSAISLPTLAAPGSFSPWILRIARFRGDAKSLQFVITAFRSQRQRKGEVAVC